METIQNGIAEGFLEAIRRDHCEQGVPVIGHQQPAKEVGAIKMPDILDIAVQEPKEPIRMDIHIPENIRQLPGYVHFGDFGGQVLKISVFQLFGVRPGVGTRGFIGGTVGSVIVGSGL